MSGPDYRGRTVVVTGAYGYLGTGMSALLAAGGADVRRASRGRPGVDSSAWVGDLLDQDFCDRLVAGASAVFHFAGQTSVKASEDDPVGDLRANVESTLRLLAACGRAKTQPAFVYAGTATEVGLTESVPVSAEQPDLPITVYDANKLAAEHQVGVYTSMGVVRGVTLRIANVFGPGAAKSAPERGVTNKMIARALAGQPLTYFGDGALVRDYVYVDDLLDAFFRAGLSARAGAKRSYVVAGGVGVSLRAAFELIADVVATMGRPRVEVVSAPWPDGIHPIDRRSFATDVAPLAEFCGWRPTTSLAEGIRRTAEAFVRG